MTTAPAFRCPCGDPLLKVLRPLLEPTLRNARDGHLTHDEATELASGQLALRLLPKHAAFDDEHHAILLSRAIYQQAVSWALFSDEWLDALATLLLSSGRTRVLEVAAGSGVLAAPMQRRGLAWRTTDEQPSHIGLAAEQTPVDCDALTALERFGDETDVLFWAWWPIGDEGDAALLAECARRRLPAIYVGEPCGGCTGSVALWSHDPAPEPLFEARLGSAAPSGATPGVDVPQWPGMKDRTFVVHPSLFVG